MILEFCLTRLGDFSRGRHAATRDSLPKKVGISDTCRWRAQNHRQPRVPSYLCNDRPTTAGVGWCHAWGRFVAVGSSASCSGRLRELNRYMWGERKGRLSISPVSAGMVDRDRRAST